MANPMHKPIATRLLSLLQQDSSLLIFELLLRTGCRCHELGQLEIMSDRVLVRAAKGGKNHYIPLEESFLARLGCHWHDIQADMARYSHQSYKAILRARWARLRNAHAFLTPYSLHSLRSAFAISVYQATKDIMLTQHLLGHVSLNSTASYVQMANLEDSRAMILKAVG